MTPLLVVALCAVGALGVAKLLVHYVSRRLDRFDRYPELPTRYDE